jgi:hypothetical protein
MRYSTPPGIDVQTGENLFKYRIWLYQGFFRINLPVGQAGCKPE